MTMLAISQKEREREIERTEIPKAPNGSILASMQVTMANFLAGGIGSSPYEIKFGNENNVKKMI
jgi:hypothetical protein